MTLRQWLMVVGLAAALACDDGPGPLGSNVQVSFATRDPTLVPGGARSGAWDAATDADTIRDGTNTLVITKAEIVLREIQFERQEIADCDVLPEPAGCEDVELGPVLVDLPLAAGAAERFTVALPTGTYVEVEFEIHKVSSGDQDDAAFRQQHPTFPVETSIRVQGTYNGQAFDFRTDLDVEQELDLVPALVIDETTTSTNVTIRVGLADWFRALDGSLVDPATGNKGGVNESLIKENIKQSVEAFEDRDGDGGR